MAHCEGFPCSLCLCSRKYCLELHFASHLLHVNFLLLLSVFFDVPLYFHRISFHSTFFNLRLPFSSIFGIVFHNFFYSVVIVMNIVLIRASTFLSLVHFFLILFFNLLEFSLVHIFPLLFFILFEFDCKPFYNLKELHLVILLHLYLPRKINFIREETSFTFSDAWKIRVCG